jgi:hypothetical protein
MLAGRLRHTLTFVRPALSVPDMAGGFETGDTAVCTARGSLEFDDAPESANMMQREGRARVTVKTRYDARITSACEFLWTGRRFRVTSVVNLKGRGREMRITAEELQAA